MGLHRAMLTPEERARITELQDLLIDRFVEHRQATAAGQEARVKIVEAEIDGLLAEKAEIEKWAARLSLAAPNTRDRCLRSRIDYAMGRFGPVNGCRAGRSHLQDRLGASPWVVAGFSHRASSPRRAGKGTIPFSSSATVTSHCHRI
jgi:hypothetical protein